VRFSGTLTGGEIMPSRYEEFWANASLAFVANSAAKPFPELGYVETRNLGK